MPDIKVTLQPALDRAQASLLRQVHQQATVEIAQYYLTQTRMAELGLRGHDHSIDSHACCGLSHRKVVTILGVAMIIGAAFVIICSIKLYNQNSTSLTQRNITTYP